MNKNKLIFYRILTALICLGFTYVILKMTWGSGTVLLITAVVVCVMGILETAALPKIIIGRKDTEKLGEEAVNSVIKFMTFFTYIAAYAVIPYGAVIIKYDGVNLFGLSKDFLASLPASILCIGIFAALLMGQKIKNALGIRLYILLTGACGIIAMILPYFKLKTPYILISSALIGVCLGFERWLMNYLVAAASDNEADTKVKYGLYNCGLLTGLTLGGSLGGIISYAAGYRFVYFAGGNYTCGNLHISFFHYALPLHQKKGGCTGFKAGNKVIYTFP
ncbi:MAG: hypothetical protein LUG66_02640 [Clostridiales bacterium]|nr:hypothetical protein [Clostridiales bacterium]